ncbi:hypothetical protein C1Y63_03730 [Corynebacterium sp. 13CS0277]|uniref:hypothetical protein n=1 Tax=Corynebacterium sp. 13CS0277 TaxID=2071994 RepID=UPI000D02EEF3|nr:hypothetical protein [Corynebacterium sp. 13CS0277]PRQ11972.1 hypothetical protein C1Y63_03730 [Corynebacterium sp. 13CS0277]
MKFRKSLVAAAAALSMSAGIVTAAPALAADDSSASSSESFGITEALGSYDPSLEESFTCFEDRDKDGFKEEYKCVRPVPKGKQFVQNMKDIIALIGTIGSLFAAVMTLTNNADKLSKAFAR